MATKKTSTTTLQRKKADALILLDRILPVKSNTGSAELVEQHRQKRLNELLNTLNL